MVKCVISEQHILLAHLLNFFPRELRFAGSNYRRIDKYGVGELVLLQDRVTILKNIFETVIKSNRDGVFWKVLFIFEFLQSIIKSNYCRILS